MNRGVRSFESGSLKIDRKGKFNIVSIQGIGKVRFKGDEADEYKLVRVVKTALRVKVQIVYEEARHSVVDSRAPVGIDLGVSKQVTVS